MQKRIAEISRFVIAGCANTLLSLAVYQLLVTIIAPSMAYSLAWLFGLLFVALVYPRMVFRVQGSLMRGASLAAVYASVFVVGFVMIDLLEFTKLNPRLSIFLVLPTTTALNYLGSRAAISLTGGASIE
jgi:putative flippase GtrA